MANGFIEPEDHRFVSASTLAAWTPHEQYEAGKSYMMLQYMASLDKASNRRGISLMDMYDNGQGYLAAEKIVDNRFGVENEDGLTPAALGTHVHGVLEDMLMTGDLNPRKATENPYGTTHMHVKQLQDWMEVCNPELVLAEKFVYNWELGFGGTVDLVCNITIDGVRTLRVIIDLKTTAKAPKKFYVNKYGLQLATYWASSHLWGDRQTRTNVNHGRVYLMTEEEHEQSDLFMPCHKDAYILTVWPDGWKMTGIDMIRASKFIAPATACYWYGAQASEPKTRNPFLNGVVVKGNA